MLLIFDGHPSHTKNTPALELAADSNVVCFVLPPHCTHRMQPVDLSFNKALSSYMTSSTISYTRNNHKVKKTLTLKNF